MELNEARTRLAAAPTSAASARTFVRSVLSGCHHDLVEVVLLLTSELVTNAVVHTGSDVELIVRPCAAGVRVEVHDADSKHFPVLRKRRFFDERGRGILLVDELALRWGAERSGSGKWVWFEVGVEIDLRDGDGASAVPRSADLRAFRPRR